MKIKKCKICGKEFQCTGTAVTCSLECGYENKRRWGLEYYQRVKEEKHDKYLARKEKKKEIQEPGVSLDQALSECNALGLSYGQYAMLRDTGKLEKYKEEHSIG